MIHTFRKMLFFLKFWNLYADWAAMTYFGLLVSLLKSKSFYCLSSLKIIDSVDLCTRSTWTILKCISNSCVKTSYGGMVCFRSDFCMSSLSNRVQMRVLLILQLKILPKMFLWEDLDPQNSIFIFSKPKKILTIYKNRWNLAMTTLI